MTLPAPPYPVLDLLRERRQEMGLDTMSSLLGFRGHLVRRGALIGAALVGGAALLCGLVALRHQWIRGALARLEPLEAEMKSLSEQNDARQAALNQQSTTNRELASALTTVRTSSALLTELQLRTPVGIRLSSVVVLGPSLALKGQASDPLAFVRINALQLELKRSPLLDARGVTLVKSERVVETGSGTGLPTGPGQVSFEISSPFAALEARQQLAVLRQLGSDGMARRLELLQREGLLP
jgi:type IV pilus assembly protein PilN